MKLTKLFTITLVTLSLIMLFSCSQGGGEGISIIPDSNYNLLISADFKTFFDSDVWEVVEEELDKESLEELFKELEKQISIDREDLTSMVVAIELEEEMFSKGSQPENGLVYVSGKVDEGDVEDLLKDDPLVSDLDDDEIDGIQMFTWTKADKDKAIAFLTNGYLRGPDNNVEDALELRTKGGERLIDSKDYLEAAAIFSNNSTFTMNIWQLDDLLENGLEQLGESNPPKDEEELLEALEELTAASFNIDFDKDINGSLKLLFAEEDAAETTVDYLEDLLKSLDEKPFFAQLGFSESLKEYLESLDIKANGNICEIAFEIETDSEIFEEFLGTFKEASQKASVANTRKKIQDVGIGIEQYLMDNYYVGCPKVDNIDDLQQIFIDTQINENAVSMKDDWGNPLVYVPDPEAGARSYRIISYGSDGKEGPEPATPGISTNSKEDIIWENGRFIQR